MCAQPAGITLYSGPLSMFGAKVQIAALEKGLDFDLVMVAYDSRLGYCPKHAEVLRVNPKGQVPVLILLPGHGCEVGRRQKGKLGVVLQKINRLLG